MDPRLPLRDVLVRIVDDLNIILKQIVTIMCLPRDQRILNDRDADITKLMALFQLKERELEESMKIAAGQVERQKIIEDLQNEVRKRDESIAKIFGCFKEAEDVLINAIFQANRKLKSIGEAERRKVLPSELIKYAHKISSSNAVAAPLTWQHGDPQRPYPLEVEIWQGWPERLKERSKVEKEFMPSLPQGPPFPGQVPPQHEFFTRPQQVGGIFPPPPQIPSSPMHQSRPQTWVTSPRSVQVSPRVQRPATPGSSASQPLGPMTMSVRSPFSSSAGQSQQHQHLQNPNTSQISTLLKMEATAATNVPNSIEVLSSDSSSSSDSDSQ